MPQHPSGNEYTRKKHKHRRKHRLATGVYSISKDNSSKTAARTKIVFIGVSSDPGDFVTSL